jgi:hypothetical protein
MACYRDSFTSTVTYNCQWQLHKYYVSGHYPSSCFYLETPPCLHYKTTSETGFCLWLQDNFFPHPSHFIIHRHFVFLCNAFRGFSEASLNKLRKVDNKKVRRDIPFEWMIRGVRCLWGSGFILVSYSESMGFESRPRVRVSWGGWRVSWSLVAGIRTLS